jgi:hypothetical protein|nr:MAG TPA: hypothetical protein [Caudoviricetes sp.]
MGNFDIEKQNAKYKYRARSKKKNATNHPIHEHECNYDIIDEIDPNINNMRYGGYDSTFTNTDNMNSNGKIKKSKKNNKKKKKTDSNGSFDYSKNNKTISMNRRSIESSIGDPQKLYDLISVLCGIISTRDRNDAYTRNMKSNLLEDEQYNKHMIKLISVILICITIGLLGACYFIYRYNVEELRVTGAQNASIINTVKNETDELNNKNQLLRQTIASINKKEEK